MRTETALMRMFVPVADNHSSVVDFDVSVCHVDSCALPEVFLLDESSDDFEVVRVLAFRGVGVHVAMLVP